MSEKEHEKEDFRTENDEIACKTKLARNVLIERRDDEARTKTKRI